jgi:hypothetical protein
MTNVTYNHPHAGTLEAIPAAEFDAANPGYKVPPMADWVVTREDGSLPVLGYVTDERAVFSDDTPSATSPDDEGEEPFEAYHQRGRYITATHSRRGALLAVGNQVGT